jgi:YidC/Oxa1 family membrane protein insertase
MILAVALSFLFFLGYSYFLPKQQSVLDQNQTTTQQVSQNAPASNIQAPAGANQAPADPSSVNVAAPVSVKNTANIISTVKAKDFQLEIDNLGRIIKYEILNEQFRSEDGSYPSLISDKSSLKPLEIRFKDQGLNSEAFKQNYTADKAELSLDDKSQTIILKQTLSTTTVTKEITFNVDGSYKIKISLTSPSDYFISPGFRPDEAADMYTFKGTLIEKSDGTTETIKEGDAEGNEVFMGASVLASSDKYYTTTFYDYENRFNIFMSKDVDDNPLPFIKGSQNMSLNGYIGAKEYDKLNAINPNLTKIIEYGFFTFIAKPVFLLLKYIYSILGNWGWSIVAITLLIRLVLYPLTYKGMVSMNRLKELSPKIKEIQKQFKGEPQKMNAKMMELYKKNNANPMGGCLPMIMQIPVFFAIYRVLLNSIELKHASWIAWYQDLSIMDPYYVLPVLMGASMFWQQRITPTNFTDPMQEKIMKFLPLIFTFFFVTFPAGLTLYWFTNNLFSVGQQYYVNSIFAKEKAKKAAS